MDMVPPGSFDDGIRFPSLEEDLELSDSAKRARKAMTRVNPDAKPKRFKREEILTSFANAFQELGGDARMIEWADQNYGEFMKLFGKTLTPAVNQMQVNASGPVQIVCPIPQSALDEAQESTPDGKVIEHDPGT